MLVPFLFVLAADPLVRVDGATSCPTSGAVALELERFLPPRPQGEEPDRAELASGPGGLRIQLRRPDGMLAGERILDVGSSCADMAKAAAVIIVVWELPLRPGLVPPLETIEPPRARPAESGVALQAQPAPRRSRWRWEPGVGFTEVLPAALPGAVVEAVARRRAAGWGGRVALSGAWWTDADLGPGRVSWTRLVLAAGLIHGWSSSRLFLDLREQVQGAALVVAGHGYDETRRPVGFDPGIAIGLRAGTVVGGLVRLWADAGLAYWPATNRISVAGLPDPPIAVSHVDVALTVGGTFLGSR
jgi:hypothetical protein